MGENPMTTSSQDFSDVSWSIQDDQAFDIMIRTATAVCKAFIQTYGAFGVTKFAIAISTAVSRLLEHQMLSYIQQLFQLFPDLWSFRCYQIALGVTRYATVVCMAVSRLLEYQVLPDKISYLHGGLQTLKHQVLPNKNSYVHGCLHTFGTLGVTRYATAVCMTVSRHISSGPVIWLE